VPGSVARPAIEAVFTMWPKPCRSMTGYANCTPWMTPFRFTTQDPVPRFERVLPDLPGDADAGIVEDVVESAEPSDGLVHHLVELAALVTSR
jgi:hypothetical protein